MIWETLGAGVLAGVLGLDRRSVVQAGIASPLVAGLLAGLWMGGPLAGLQVGLLLSLLWLHELPVGGVIPPDDTQVAVIAGALAAILVSENPDGASAWIVLSILWAIPFGLIAQRLDGLARGLNALASRRLLQSEVPLERAAFDHLTGLAVGATALSGTLVGCVGVGAGLVVLRQVVSLELNLVWRGLTWAYHLIPLVGVAGCLLLVSRPRSGWIIAMMFALSATTLLLGGRLE